MNNYKTIVMELIDHYDQLIDNGEIECYLPGHLSFGDLIDYLNSKFYSQLENEMQGFDDSINNNEYRRIVLNKTFNILDNAELINGDMRDIYTNKFA